MVNNKSEVDAPPSWISWVVPTILALLLACTIGTAVLVSRSDATAKPGPVEPIANQAAINFFSLDYRHIEADLDRVLSMATGEFEKAYRAKAPDLQEQVVTKKLVLTAAVPTDGTALEFSSGGAAHVLVAVDVHTEDAAGAAEDAPYRVRVKLQRVDDAWLISDIEQVG